MLLIYTLIFSQDKTLGYLDLIENDSCPHQIACHLTEQSQKAKRGSVM